MSIGSALLIALFEFTSVIMFDNKKQIKSKRQTKKQLILSISVEKNTVTLNESETNGWCSVAFMGSGSNTVNVISSTIRSTNTYVLAEGL